MTTNAPVLGQVKVCKVFAAGSDPAVTSAQFTLVGGPGPGAGAGVAAGSPLTITGGTCKIVAESEALANTFFNVTVDEQVYTPQSVACARIDINGTVISNPPCTFADGGSVNVNDFHGYVLTFTNYIAPTAPPAQLAVVKTPDAGTFTQGGQASFTIVVRNPAAAGSMSATNVVLSDALPGNGGLVFTTATTTQGTCVSPIVGNNLSCSLGTIAPQGSVTVTVSTAATTPAAACQTQNNPAANATAAGGLTATDAGSLRCTPVQPPALGRMTGGGSVFTTAGDRVTHGFELHCDKNDPPNNLEINWGGNGKGSNNFHLETLTSAVCTDDPAIAPPPPDASFDTYNGTGIGKLNGVLGATITFTLTDAGEPGKNDTATFVIKDANNVTVLTVSGTLRNGNHQAHK